MTNVVALEDYRMRRESLPERGPVINDGQIFSRDYSGLDGIVFGALKVREVLEHHAHHAPGWRMLLLDVLDAAYGLNRGGDSQFALREAVSELKGFILEETTRGNKRDLSAVLMILDLIEKSPGYRRPKSPPGASPG